MDFLVDNGADLNLVDINGETALMAAARNGHFAAVVKLVEAGANVTKQNLRGVTAVDIAMAHEKKDAYEYLFNKTASMPERMARSLADMVDSMTLWWRPAEEKESNDKKKQAARPKTAANAKATPPPMMAPRPLTAPAGVTLSDADRKALDEAKAAVGGDETLEVRSVTSDEVPAASDAGKRQRSESLRSEPGLAATQGAAAI